jgi:molybdopterin synthase catalytic subunit
MEVNTGCDRHMWDDLKRDYVSLSYRKLNVGALTAMVGDPSAGAISSFIGITRNNFQGKEVLHLSYEAYDEMALTEMLALCVKVRSKWQTVTKIAIEHKLGDCPVGDMSVVIVISSPHRVESLEACHFAIDELKKTIPIWKKEHYAESSGGDAAWKKNPESPQPLLKSDVDSNNEQSTQPPAAPSEY